MECVWDQRGGQTLTQEPGHPGGQGLHTLTTRKSGLRFTPIFHVIPVFWTVWSELNLTSLLASR